MTKKFYYGGQAVIEGVMMRGQKTVVTAVRRPNGDVAIDTQPLTNLYTGWMRRTPFIRGVIVLIEGMVLGVKAILHSASVSLEEEDEEVSWWMVWVMMAVSLALAVSLFFMAPLFITRALNIESSLLFNLVSGLIRVVIFIAYLKLMSFMPDIKRVFAYHGAEHKTVNAYEAGVPMEVEAVKKYSTRHMRCGTSFLTVVLAIAIIVFSLFGLHSTWLMVISRIALIPVIAGISYEVIYFGSRHVNNRLGRIILAPGLWFQRLTTREPDDSQLEVALSALKEVLANDQPEEVPQTATG